VNYNDFPIQGTPPVPCGGNNFYSCPSISGLGNTNKTIGSPRQIQMSLRVLF